MKCDIEISVIKRQRNVVRCPRCGVEFGGALTKVEALGCCKSCMTDDEEYDICVPWITKMFKGIDVESRRRAIRAVILDRVESDLAELKRRGYIR